MNHISNETYRFALLELTSIRPNPLNPRKTIAGKEFDELVASIAAQGVIQPIVVRQKLCMETCTDYELVAGHRRHKAAIAVANNNGGLAGAVIPAIVRDLTDDETYEIIMIENLQREGLTELEQAESFKAYLNKRGDIALIDLADKCGINPAYIRRRIAVLSLPKDVLTAWESGDLSFGHLEQFIRLKENKAEINRLHDELKVGWRIRTVSDLKRAIDSQAPALAEAVFDIEKCKSCTLNSDVQKKLFAFDTEKTRCMKPDCFYKKTLDNIKAVAETLVRKHKTFGFRVIDCSDKSLFIGKYDCNEFGRNHKQKPKCFECESHVTVFEKAGSVKGKCCIGSNECFYRPESAKSNAGHDPDHGPRVSWHGGFFRDKFYQSALPLKYEQYEPDDAKILRLVLFSIIKPNNGIHPWASKRLGIASMTGPDAEDDPGRSFLSAEELFEKIQTLYMDELKPLLKEASLQMAMAEDPTSRKLMASHLGADLESEFCITEEYLSKKTKAEILAFGEKYKIFDDQRVQAFLFEKLLKKRGKVNNCKKPELIRLLLESGVDLTGKVPDEIIPQMEMKVKNHADHS